MAIDTVTKKSKRVTKAKGDKGGTCVPWLSCARSVITGTLVFAAAIAVVGNTMDNWARMMQTLAVSFWINVCFSVALSVIGLWLMCIVSKIATKRRLVRRNTFLLGFISSVFAALFAFSVAYTYGSMIELSATQIISGMVALLASLFSVVGTFVTYQESN